MTRFACFILILVCATNLQAAEQTIFLVRHAEKATDGDGKDPDLSDAGRARAQALALVLKDCGITAVYVSEFKRSQETAEPLAQSAGLKATIVPAKETEVLVAKLKETKGNALVIAHSNTIPGILKALGAATSPQIDETEYDNLFVFVPGTSGTLLHLHYR